MHLHARSRAVPCVPVVRSAGVVSLHRSESIDALVAETVMVRRQREESARERSPRSTPVPVEATADDEIGISDLFG